MSLPPAKRQRIEDAPITRSEIWYSDGSVVLQAETSQFRVHWSVLAQHSSFFLGLQALPQPESGQPTMDGCPLLELQDTAADVEHLLKALYDPALFHQKAIPFPYIASFVRLGRKYDFKVLFDIAVERLAFESPTTLKEYDTLFDAFKGTSSETTKIVPYGGIYRDMLTLLRENGLQKMLPCAYLRLSKQTMDSIFGERLRPDGTLCALSPIDHRVCGVGRERLLEAQWKTGNTLGWIIPWKPAEGCEARYYCRNA
ncbi:hypothetical protein B0H14DRAFT_3497130 [Mycena olivaceomarginata]|nr:hypothetical protein B0H14DRAFT_3497130 [Mycena olivaceomarginata]